jgi:hypothetical protein
MKPCHLKRSWEKDDTSSFFVVKIHVSLISTHKILFIWILITIQKFLENVEIGSNEKQGTWGVLS